MGNHALILLVVLIILIIIIVVFFNNQYPTQEEKNSNQWKLWLALVIVIVVILVIGAFWSNQHGKEHHVVDSDAEMSWFSDKKREYNAYQEGKKVSKEEGQRQRDMQRIDNQKVKAKAEAARVNAKYEARDKIAAKKAAGAEGVKAAAPAKSH